MSSRRDSFIFLFFFASLRLFSASSVSSGEPRLQSVLVVYCDFVLDIVTASRLYPLFSRILSREVDLDLALSAALFSRETLVDDKDYGGGGG
jgi:hypothetical protein